MGANKKNKQKRQNYRSNDDDYARNKKYKKGRFDDKRSDKQIYQKLFVCNDPLW